MYEEDDLLPISALQHLLFCERRAALVYTEGLWDENRFTAEGKLRHERAHEVASESRGDVRIVRALRLRSLSLGLTGQADVVEFHRMTSADKTGGMPLHGADGRWRPVPVEYKRGRQRREEGYEVQLCAQAMCLEEMLGVSIPAAALFYAASQRRMEVSFTAALREQTRASAVRLHQVLESGRTPAPEFGTKCGCCSLHDQCLPTAVQHCSVLRYVADAFKPDGPGP